MGIGVAERPAIASAMIQPITVQPRKMLITQIEPAFRTFLDWAMIPGRK
jgi:hypothetical protein